jgi:hypothetical protein
MIRYSNRLWAENGKANLVTNSLPDIALQVFESPMAIVKRAYSICLLMRRRPFTTLITGSKLR